MNENIFKRNEKLAKKVIEGLKSRNMTGYYASSKEEALKIALDLIPEGSKVGKGGAQSAVDIGLDAALRSGNYDYVANRLFETNKEGYMFSYMSDVFIGSTNAITEDGILVNIDGTSNRVSAYAYGPDKLILIVGMNKVAKDVDDAMKRARNIAAPANAQRFDVKTPCNVNGTCANCKSPDTICCQFLITRFSRQTDRIHVILVNDNLGF